MPAPSEDWEFEATRACCANECFEALIVLSQSKFSVQAASSQSGVRLSTCWQARLIGRRI